MSASTVSERPPSPRRWRLLIAFAVLPPFDALLAFVGFPAVWWLGDHGASRLLDPDQAARAFAILAGVLGILVTICGAVPVTFSLLKRGPVSLAQLLVAGVALGNAPFAAYALILLPFAILHVIEGTMSEHLVPLPDLLAGVLRAVLIGSVMGTASAVVFWLVGIRGADVGQPSSSSADRT